ncbi:unnamed protein product, partial [Heterosigma akashiwo]
MRRKLTINFGNPFKETRSKSGKGQSPQFKMIDEAAAEAELMTV